MNKVIPTIHDCGVGYFTSHLAEFEARALRAYPFSDPISVCGISPRRLFTAGLFPGFDKTWRVVDNCLSAGAGTFPNYFGMEMAACYLNLNCDHPRLMAGLPWRVCSDEDGIFIKSEHGIRLARAASGNRWVLSVTDKALPVQPSDLAMQVRNFIDQALDREISLRRPSLVFPKLADNCVLQRVAWEVFMGTVFSPTSRAGDAYGRRRETGRFLFIDRLHEARHNANACDDVIAALEVLPQLMFVRGWCGGTPLHDSCEYSITQLVEWILDYTCDAVSFKTRGESRTLNDLLAAQDNDGCTPLHRAALSNDHNLYELLLSVGAPPHTRDRYGLAAVSYLE